MADITGAAWLIEELEFDALIADKGYDADWLREMVITRATPRGELTAQFRKN